MVYVRSLRLILMKIVCYVRWLWIRYISLLTFIPPLYPCPLTLISHHLLYPSPSPLPPLPSLSPLPPPRPHSFLPPPSLPFTYDHLYHQQGNPWSSACNGYVSHHPPLTLSSLPSSLPPPLTCRHDHQQGNPWSSACNGDV